MADAFLVEDFRLALGTLTAVALNTGSGYLLQNFPVQTDQVSILVVPWGPPMDDPSAYPRRGWSALTLDEGQTLHGKYRFDWIFAYWTEGMIDYFETTFFGASIYGGPISVAGSAAVTVRTLMRNGVYWTFTGKMLYPNEEEFYQNGERGLERYHLRFRGLSVAG